MVLNAREVGPVRTGWATEPEMAAARTICWAIATGFVCGGIAGTPSVPVLGTLVGEFLGSVVGSLFGLVIAPVATVVARSTRSRPIARVACGLTSLGCGAIALLAWPHFALPINALTVGLWLGACAGLGAWFGPGVAFGFRPMRFGVFGRGATRSSAQWVARFTVYSLIAGAVVGAPIGFVVGLFVHWQTSPVAAIEGAALGMIFLGLMLLAPLGLVVVAVRLRPIEPAPARYGPES